MKKDEKWSMAVILISIGVLGTMQKNLKKPLDELEIRGKIERIPDHKTVKESWRSKETYCPSDTYGKLSVRASAKSLKGVNYGGT